MSGDAPAQKQKVYAVIPAKLPWAAKSLPQSCDTLHVVLPTWFHITGAEGAAQVVGVSSGTRDPVLEYIEKSPQVDILPLLQLEV